jgi:MYXO-CTERM domain-containing protein
MVGGTNNNFSINNGTALLKLWNDPNVNSLDSRDWAPGTNDSFNQFSNANVVNPVSAVDVRLMDVIGYDLVPEPTGIFTGLIFLGGAALRRRRRA